MINLLKKLLSRKVDGILSLEDVERLGLITKEEILRIRQHRIAVELEDLEKNRKRK